MTRDASENVHDACSTFVDYAPPPTHECVTIRAVIGRTFAGLAAFGVSVIATGCLMIAGLMVNGNFGRRVMFANSWGLIFGWAAAGTALALVGFKFARIALHGRTRATA